MADYIEQRRRRWYFVIDVPQKLRPLYDGKKRIVRSLETDSRSEAIIRAKPLTARYKAEFEAYRTGKSPLSVNFMSKALEWREDYRRALGDPELLSTYEEVLESEASNLVKSTPQLAKSFPGLVRGEFIPTAEHLDAFANAQRVRVKPKTVDMRCSDIQEFSKTFPTTDQINRKSVKRWVNDLEAKGTKQATITRKLGGLRAYWRYLQDNDFINREDDPFSNIMTGDKKKRTKTESGSWEPFTDAQVLELLHAAQRKRSPDHQLADLIRLGMWTGCRIEELCVLRVDHVHEDFIRIVDAKTPKGIREVPIHRELAPVIRRLVAISQDGYVLSGLGTVNKYASRSSAIGKRFGKLKNALGFGPKHVFHSIRKTVVTILENAEVPEGVVADIVGHEKQTMTYGLYSGGSSLERKSEALGHLKYSGWTALDAHPLAEG